MAALKGAEAEGTTEPVFVFPASFAQARLWFLDQFEPGTPLYHVRQGVRVTGALCVPALRQALDALVSRHESLRTTFTTVDGRPVQVVAETGAASLSVIPLGGLPEAERELAARRRMGWLRGICPTSSFRGVRSTSL